MKRFGAWLCVFLFMMFCVAENCLDEGWEPPFDYAGHCTFEQGYLEYKTHMLKEPEQTINAVIRGLYFIDYCKHCHFIDDGVLDLEEVQTIFEAGKFTKIDRFSFKKEDIFLCDNVYLDFCQNSSGGLETIALVICGIDSFVGDELRISFDIYSNSCSGDQTQTSCTGAGFSEEVINQQLACLSHKDDTKLSILRALYFIDFLQNCIYSEKPLTYLITSIFLDVGAFSYSELRVSENEYRIYFSDDVYMTVTCDNDQHVVNLSYEIQSLNNAYGLPITETFDAKDMCRSEKARKLLEMY